MPDPARTATFTPEPATVAPGQRGESGQVSDVRADGPRQLPKHIGRFEIRRWLGEGAFGHVYQAYDPHLDREVALKVAKLDEGDTEQRLQRFLREAKAAANLRHPHLVPVFEFGQEGNQFFIASAFIKGRTLQAFVEEQKRTGARPDLHRGAQIIRQLAEGLAYAHGQGIVHRDVKPANVMLDERGESLLMDFGLAARQQEAEKLTHAGAILGTPLYMAPEQARGQDGAAQPASDQYSLGVMLFELLTGRRPFEGKPHLVMHHHLETQPPFPRKFNPAVPRDLETVCLKCLEKNPARRYGTCQALADDLRRWREGEPVLARRAGLLERAGKWCRKNPLSAALMAAVAGLLVLGTAIALAFAFQAEDSAALAKRNENTALKALERAEWLVYAGKISLAQLEWEAGNVGIALDSLHRCRDDFRGWEHDYLYTLFNSNQLTMSGPGAYFTSVAFSPDGKRLVSGGGTFNGPVRCQVVTVWDTQTGLEILALKGHTAYVTSVAYSPDGKRIVSGSSDNTVKVWDAVTGQNTLTLRAHTGGVSSVAISPDGQRLASGGGDKMVKIWDAQTGQNIRILEGHSDRVRSVAFSPDGKRLASGSWDGTVKV